MRMRLSLVLVSLIAAAAAMATGCAEPDVSGTVPPRGVVEGSITYLGPRPLCEYEGDGDSRAATRIMGRVVLFLFPFDNPPPPEGTSTSPVSFLTVPAPQIFTGLEDCMPENPTPEQLAEPIQRSAGFTWSEVPLAQRTDAETPANISYVMRGFMDRDEDFNPFFGATTSPTFGDVGGGAVVNSQDPSLGFSPVIFGDSVDNPNGQLVGGVSVVLGGFVQTEVPVSFLTQGGTFNAEDNVPFGSNDIFGDLGLVESELNNRYQVSLSLYPRTAGETDARTSLDTALAAANLDFDTENELAYSWSINGISTANGDDEDMNGINDHPTLGAFGYQDLEPSVLMLRIQSEIEAQAGIPAVVILPAVPQLNPSIAVEVGDRLYPDVSIIVPPLAAILSNPNDPACQLPVLGPRSAGVAYSLNTTAPIDCMEIPTGRYAMNILHARAFAEVEADPDAPGSNRLTGGIYASQVWSLPNDLGDPDQLKLVDDDAFEDTNDNGEADCDEPGVTCNHAPLQGLAGTFLVSEADTDNYWTRRNGTGDQCYEVEGIVAPPYTTIDDSSFLEFRGFDDPDAARASCCGPIMHLCDVPLCDPVPDPINTDRMVRGTPTSVDADGVPNCVPFAMPATCCPDPIPAAPAAE